MRMRWPLGRLTCSRRASLPGEETRATSSGLGQQSSRSEHITGDSQSPLLKVNQEVKDRTGTWADHPYVVELMPHQSHFFLQGVSISFAGRSV